MKGHKEAAMKKIQMSWWLGAGAVAVVVLGAILAAPAWAAASRQGDGPSPDSISAMHAACEAGDAQGMRASMEGLSDEDREAMGEHMGNDGHGAMNGHMGGAMAGGMMQSFRGLLGWR
jgi:hypothetical protein